MVIYNTKEVAIINGKYVSIYCHLWFAWNDMGYNFVFRVVFAGSPCMLSIFSWLFMALESIGNLGPEV